MEKTILKENFALVRVKKRRIFPMKIIEHHQTYIETSHRFHQQWNIFIDYHLSNCMTR